MLPCRRFTSQLRRLCVGGPRFYQPATGQGSIVVSIRRSVEPYKCLGLGVSDPRCFLVGVAVGIVGVEVASAIFFLFVGHGHLRMCAQVVPERDVTNNLTRPCLEKMKLRHAGSASV